MVQSSFHLPAYGTQVVTLLKTLLLDGSFCQVRAVAMTCPGGRRVQSKQLVFERRANTIIPLGTQLSPSNCSLGNDHRPSGMD